jgi:hypothetical protein
MQCKDIPDRPVLVFLAGLGRWGTWLENQCGELFPNSVQNAMPAAVGEKLARAKMAMLIRRGLVDGCSCGCRGDYELTDKGREFISE